MTTEQRDTRHEDVDRIEAEIRERVHGLAFDNRGLAAEVERLHRILRRIYYAVPTGDAPALAAFEPILTVFRDVDMDPPRMTEQRDTPELGHEHWPGQTRCEWCVGDTPERDDPYETLRDCFNDATHRLRGATAQRVRHAFFAALSRIQAEHEELKALADTQHADLGRLMGKLDEARAALEDVRVSTTLREARRIARQALTGSPEPQEDT